MEGPASRRVIAGQSRSIPFLPAKTEEYSLLCYRPGSANRPFGGTRPPRRAPMLRAVLDAVPRTGWRPSKETNVTGHRMGGDTGKREEAMELDRRNFLKTLAVGSAVMAGAGLAGCAPKTKAEAGAAPAGGGELPDSWDEECDVLVIGSGYCGPGRGVRGQGRRRRHPAGREDGHPWAAIPPSPTATSRCACLRPRRRRASRTRSSKYVARHAGGRRPGLERRGEMLACMAEKSNETWEWTRRPSWAWNGTPTRTAT